MSVRRRGSRAGVAAVVLGLSLAGPQATGVAAAETDDGESASVSASEASQQGASAKSRATRSPGIESAGNATRRGRLTPAPAAATGPVDTTEGPRPVTRVPARRSAPRVSGGLPTAVSESAAGPATGVAATGNTAAGEVTIPVGVPAVGGLTPAPPLGLSPPVVRLPRFLNLQAPVLAQPIAAIGTAVNELFDSAANWLSGLPASPITEFLEGALLLVRRSLVNLFSALGAGQTTGQTGETGAAYLTEAELNAYLLELAQQQYGGLFGQTVPVYGYGPWPDYYQYLKAEAGSGLPGGASDTNTQVDGVDEADFVESDGQYLYVAHNGSLRIVRTDLTVASETALSGDVVGSYLSGDRLTVVTQAGSGWYGPMVKMAYGPWGPWNPQTTLTVYDVSDRTAPVVVNQTVFDGGYQSSRAVDGVVYVVLQRSVNLPAPQYTETPVVKGGTVDLGGDADVLVGRPWIGSEITGYRTYETWDAYVARVGPQIANLSLPHAYSMDAEGNLVDLGLVAAASDIVRPHTDDRQALLTVVSVDSATNSSGYADSVAALVAATGGAVYMTPESLYVASNEDQYSDGGWASGTRIDRFTVAGTDIGWQAGGVVSGTLINQFAMDERDGYLRVGTHSSGSQLVDGVWSSRNDSGIYVLDTAGDTLDVVGGVTGLAPGEQLYAVRFVGDTGYLVTFLQTDPLFAVDLSDPTDPVLLGELVVPGFSNYLQPVGDGLLLGIGQEREAGSWNTHLHASLFDVTDGSNPTQIDREFLDAGYQWSWSEAQFDHHALLYSAQDGLLVVPVGGSGYDAQTGHRYDQFLKVLRVTPTGIEVVGEIHTDEPVLRTVRIGDVLYAVGHTSVTAFSVNDLTEIGRSAPVPSLV